MSRLLISILGVFLALSSAQARRRPRAVPTPASRGPNLGNAAQVAEFCSLFSWSKPHQREKCLADPQVMTILQLGVAMAIRVCPNHFGDHKWNCSGLNTAQVLQAQGILQTQTKESAYVYALSSAGVAFEVTRGCSSGKLDPWCGCDVHVQGRGRDETKGGSSWEWGGCSEDIGYGDDISRRFLDPDPPRRELAYLFAKHNNEAGRKALRDNMGKTCKCHGVSGSCTVKICWKTMPDFDVVAELLRKKFDHAIKVKLNTNKTRLIKISRGKRGKKKRSKGRRPPSDSLVFASKSLQFCKPDARYGIAGTQGRRCNPLSKGDTGCKKMCCNRGYYTMKGTKSVKCNCEFIWCCKVQCDMCKKNWTKHVCR